MNVIYAQLYGKSSPIHLIKRYISSKITLEIEQLSKFVIYLCHFDQRQLSKFKCLFIYLILMHRNERCLKTLSNIKPYWDQILRGKGYGNELKKKKCI